MDVIIPITSSILLLLLIYLRLFKLSLIDLEDLLEDTTEIGVTERTIIDAPCCTVPGHPRDCVSNQFLAAKLLYKY